jgi:hypothetical protein
MEVAWNRRGFLKQVASEGAGILAATDWFATV